jgi:hypothetical protein
MRARRDVKFYECFDCQTATVLSEIATASGCPGCGSANGHMVSNADLGRRIEAGGIVHIDLSPSIPAKSQSLGKH